MPRSATLGIGVLGAAIIVASLTGCAGPSGGAGRDQRLVSAGASSETDSTVRAVTTLGVGKASAAPDTVSLSFEVATTDSTAARALDRNNQSAAALLKTLKAQGVADADLQTTGLTIYPTYDSGNNRITGFAVTNSINATLHNLARMGSTIDAATHTTGDAIRLGQIRFSINDQTAVRARARVAAIAQARAQAQQMVGAAGAKLGAVRSIADIPETPVASPMFAASADSARVPIQPGTLDVTVSVQVAFDLAG